MAYQTIKPPFTLNFQEMSKQELKEYFAWFHSVLPERLDVLSRSVQQTPGFETWRADFTPASLDVLGSWFAMQVETRARSMDEVREIECCSPFPIDVPKDELTNRTFSLAMDVGMYLGQVFLKTQPSIRWDQQFGKRVDVDYGQPVLVGFVRPFNPIRMLVTLAYGLASGVKTGRSLRELFDTWISMVKEEK